MPPTHIQITDLVAVKARVKVESSYLKRCLRLSECSQEEIKAIYHKYWKVHSIGTGNLVFIDLEEYQDKYPHNDRFGFLFSRIESIKAYTSNQLRTSQGHNPFKGL